MATWNDVALYAARERAAAGLPQMAGSGISGHLSIGEATELDCRQAWRRPDHICEWGTWLRHFEFRCSHKVLVIVRGSSSGIDGGWKYASLGALQVEWSELLTIAFRTGDANVEVRR